MPEYNFYLLFLVLVISASSVWSQMEGNPPDCDADRHFKCDSGMCVPKALKCDRNNDCGDYSDEKRCNILDCGLVRIPCDNWLQCIRRNYWCDGIKDCRDGGSDEMYCNITGNPPNCNPELHFKCDNGMCVPKVLKCDGYNDCKDNSDEEGCYNRCGEKGIPCESSRKCISRIAWCDRYVDCPYADDERFCNREGYPQNCDADRHFKCDSGMCVPKVLKCDGYYDCGDYSDEEKCDPETETPYDLSNFTTEMPYSEEMTHLVDTEMTYETVSYLVETEMPTTTPLPQNPSTHAVPGLASRTVKFFHENESSRPVSNTDSVHQPGFSSFSRESSPFSHTALDPRNPSGLPRKYFDISISFPFRQRAQARDVPRVNDPKPSHTQGVKKDIDCLKSESSNHFQRNNERFLVDQQHQNVRKADEELSSGHASHRQGEDTPRSLLALFILSDSSVNIRVNDRTE